MAKAEKPKARSFLKAAAILGVPVEKLAMVGDQLFTDIKGANNVGAIPVRIKYNRPEVLLYFHYKKLRRKEKNYLTSKGYGDKT